MRNNPYFIKNAFSGECPIWILLNDGNIDYEKRDFRIVDLRYPKIDYNTGNGQDNYIWNNRDVRKVITIL